MLLIIVGEYSVMVELFYYLSKSSFFFFFENFIFLKLYKYNKILIYEVHSITNVLYY